MRFYMVSEPRERLELPGEFHSASASLGGTNWEREVALVVDLGEKPTGGYAVKVTAAEMTPSGDIDLRLELVQPGPGSFVTQVFTHPYAVCRLPRIGLRAGEIEVAAFDQSGAEVSRQVVHL